MCLSAITIKSNLVFDVSLAQRTSDPQAPTASASTRSVIVNEQMVEMMITGQVPQEILDPECTPKAGPPSSAEDAELAKWKAVELFKVTFAAPRPSLHFLPCTDHCELLASDGGGHRCERQVDFRVDRPLRDGR